MKRLLDIRARWAVGWVQTGHEIAVARRLRREGAETYCPRYECVTRRGAHRRPSKTVKAGYPGYIFVDYESIVDEEQIRDMPKFRYFLRNEGKVSLLPDSVIEGFRALERQGVFLPTSVEAMVSRFIVGDRVKIPQGIFGGWRGFVKEVVKGRVKVDRGDFKHPVEFADLHLEPESI